MPVIGSKACLTTKFFVYGTKKVLSFTSYWENDEGFTPTQPIMEGIANFFFAGVADVWKEVAAARYEMTGCQAIYEKTTTYWEAMSNDPSVLGNITADPTDEVGGDMMPDENCLIIQRRTGKKGRNNMGRRFLPGLDDDVNMNGVVDPDYTAKCNDIAAYFGASKTVDAGEAAGLVFNARHYDRKTPDLVPVVDARWVNLLGTRRDRQLKSLRIAR
jgi:hypothetical protein